MKTNSIIQLLSVALLMATPTAHAAETKSYPKHWGEPPAAQTRDMQPLPGGFGQGSGTLAQWIQGNLDKDKAAKSPVVTITAEDFIHGAKGYYLDQDKWLAIHPEKNKEASAQTAIPFPSGKFDVTLYVVGESDGQSTFQVAMNDTKLGDFTAPLSDETFEEGAKFSTTWKGVEISSGDVLKISSQIASSDGKEWSRARVARIDFAAADDATKQEIAKFAAAKPAKSAKSAKPESPAVPLVLPRKDDGKAGIEVTGELKEWHKVTLTLDGPFAAEQDNEPNPFTDLAFNVTFTHESGNPKYTIPGFFAADGNAGESSAESGTKWRAHLSPDKAGTWTYTTSFTQGKNAALDGGGEPIKAYHGKTGSFKVAPTDKTGRDFRAQGRLTYVGKHHLQFAGSKQYFLKAGPDSPENILGYADFDGTQSGKKDRSLKKWQPHVQDWQNGDPTWKVGKGKGIIGALNYLVTKGCNSFSFLTYNAGGDGDDVWPFTERDAKFHYDCSKLDQWGLVFDYATNQGIYCHFKLQETENDDNRGGDKKKGKLIETSLDGGELGPERKLYLREIVARFGHLLALNWNLGEENTQSTDEQRAMLDYIAKVDAYQHVRVLHTYPGQQKKVYTPLLGDQSALMGVSLQTKFDDAHEETLDWVVKSDEAKKPWVVAHDEQGPAGLGAPPDPGYEGFKGIAHEKDQDGGSEAEGHVKADGYTIDDIRKNTLWGNLMAGGAGVEYYFGYKLPQNDLQCQDFRSRAKSWDYCRFAIEFFQGNKIPFYEMKNANALIGNKKNDNSKYCLAKEGEIYLVYLPKGGDAEIDLSGISGEFKLSWFNPREGGAIKDGGKTLQGGSKIQFKAPEEQDWLAVFSRK